MKKGIFFAALVVLILGCVQAANPVSSGSKAKDAGIAIQEFSFKVPDMTDDEKAIASFSVANIGSKTVSGDIYVWFYVPYLGKNPWEIEPAGTTDISGGDAVITGETFYPPVTEKGIPGSVKKFDLILAPPDLPEGTKQKYDFYAEICYPYTTTALAEIVSTSQNEFSVQAKSDMTLAQTQSTLGPVKLTLSARKNIRTIKKIPIVFTVEDIAGGYATSNDEECTQDIKATKRDKVYVSIFVDGSADNLDCGNGDNTATVDLVRKKGLVFCSYELPEKSAPKKTLSVSALAEYKYYSRKTAGITVEDAFSQ